MRTAPDPIAALDDTDWKLLDALQKDARQSLSTLASTLGLSRPAVTDRLRYLERSGVVTGYDAQITPGRVGLGLLAFLGVVMEHPKYRAAFLRLVRDMPEILECHHVTGEFDYLLKVRCRDTDDLEALISHRLKGMQALVRTRTMISLSTEKDTRHLPLSVPAGRPRGRRRAS